jgi:hypothetical protein
MKQSIKMLSTLTLLTLFSACGGGQQAQTDRGPGNSDTTGPVEAETILDGSNIQGKYLATFTTLNPHINGTIPGSVTIKRDGDRFWAYVRLFAGAPEAWHPQAIWTGTRCPTLADDTNGDGIIDIQEAAAVLGKITIPLDANLNSQDALRNWYPKGDLSGNYFYEKMGSFTSILNDLRRPPGRDPMLKKLGPDEGLYIEGRAVMIQGISANTVLPETVQTEGRFRAFQTLPIACGIFQQVTEMPGEAWNDEVAGPVDEDEWVERPAGQGEGEDAGTGATVRGHSNDAGSVSGTTTNARTTPRNYGENN